MVLPPGAPPMPIFDFDWPIAPPTLEEDEPEPFPGTYFDTHSHNFMSTRSDWASAKAGVAGTATDARIDWLAGFQAVGVGRMVISAMVDDTSGADPVNDSVTGNEITAYAASRYPDFFVPFVQLFPDEIVRGVAFYVESMLSAGFEGVGELIIHGHGANVNDNTALVEIGKVAAAQGAPMQVHWEIGNVADWGVRTAGENFDQLIEFLTHFPAKPINDTTYRSPLGNYTLKVILCHCGAGPNGLATDRFLEYQERMKLLLRAFPNVYFDIAGMQVTKSAELYSGTTPSPLGGFLLDCIVAYPDRFLIGYDTETRFWSSTKVGSQPYWGVEDYLKSVPHYDTFLSIGDSSGTALTADQKTDVLVNNAVRLLDTRPGTAAWPTLSSAIASTSPHIGP